MIGVTVKDAVCRSVPTSPSSGPTNLGCPPGTEGVMSAFPADSSFSGVAVLEPLVREGYVVIPDVVNVQSGMPIPVVM